MRKTLKLLTFECVRASRNYPGGPDPLQFPSQVLCLSQGIMFTAQCEDSIQKGTLSSLLKSIKVVDILFPPQFFLFYLQSFLSP